MTRLALVARREPVRVYVYGVATAVVALAVVYGLLTPEQAGSWLVVAGAVVAAPVAAEGARGRVSPVTPEDVVVNRADLRTVSRFAGSGHTAGQPEALARIARRAAGPPRRS